MSQESLDLSRSPEDERSMQRDAWASDMELGLVMEHVLGERYGLSIEPYARPDFSRMHLVMELAFNFRPWTDPETNKEVHPPMFKWDSYIQGNIERIARRHGISADKVRSDGRHVPKSPTELLQEMLDTVSTLDQEPS